MTQRQVFIEDDGDALQVALVQDGHQIGAILIDIEPLGVDSAYAMANQLGQAFLA